MVTLSDPLYADEKGTSRFFTISSSPLDAGELAFTTRLSDSAFKRSVDESSLGSSVNVEIIGGDLILPKSTFRQFVFIAGGIGITPFMSMLRYIDTKKLDYKITLLYSNRTVASTAYLDELTTLAKRNKKLTLMPTMTDDPSWYGETKRIDEAFIRNYVKDCSKSECFIVGSARMVEATNITLVAMKIPSDRQHAEEFPGY